MNALAQTLSEPRAQHRSEPSAEACRPEPRRPAGGRSALDGCDVGQVPGVLGRYHDRAGRPREIVGVVAAAGSLLVVDRDAITLAGRLLVAHLGADEPVENARLVCRMYLEDESRGGCREVIAQDLTTDPFGTDAELEADRGSDNGEHSRDSQATLVDERGRRYRLERVPGKKRVPDLRGVTRESRSAPRVTVSLRDVVGALESYEPARTLTCAALGRHRSDRLLSLCVLRAELARLNVSRIVLNRGLRAAVLETMRAQELSASEIAIRCGRFKRDARGNVTGETTWLARRVGLAPESGEREPTPWIHSDVLGLIARSGLGVSPREVELG